MFSTQVVVEQWIEIPFEIRQKLIQLFNVPRTGGSLVQDGRLVTDGHTYVDLKAITVNKMQMFLNSTEKDFSKLFNNVYSMLEDERNAELESKQKIDQKIKADEENDIQSKVESAIENLEELKITVKKRGRPKKV